jgi:NADH-quinone oxidoreductase subunit L
MTHAFFKALLFLGSGSVIEACHHEQDIRKMGGLGKKLPITRTTFVIGSLALAGVPIFAGFFSKDEILYNTFSAASLGGLGKALWVVGAAAALLTAFYITRLVTLTFFGTPRDKHIHDGAKESPSVMTVPLVILAILSTLGGFLGIPLLPKMNAMHNWLSPVVGNRGHGESAHGAAGHEAAGHSTTLELILMAVSVAIAVAGIVAAWQIYVVRPQRATALKARMGTLHRVLLNKYYVDEFYHGAVVRPLVGASRALWRVFDVQVIDGLVNGSGRMMRGLAGFLRPIQSGFTGNYAAAIMVGAIVIMSFVIFGGGR